MRSIVFFHLSPSGTILTFSFQCKMPFITEKTQKSVVTLFSQESRKLGVKDIITEGDFSRLGHGGTGKHSLVFRY